jgi:hypothetical protein
MGRPVTRLQIGLKGAGRLGIGLGSFFNECLARAVRGGTQASHCMRRRRSKGNRGAMATSATRGWI